METATAEPSASTSFIEMTIDKAGRVVIPLAVRERLNLQDGSRLQLHFETDDAIVLKVVSEDPPVKKDNGVLVITSQAVGDLNSVKAVREERLQRVSGLSNRSGSLR